MVNPYAIMEAIECDELVGFCTDCGEMKDCCEPDARNYECDYCGEFRVFGAEELLIMGFCDGAAPEGY